LGVKLGLVSALLIWWWLQNQPQQEPPRAIKAVARPPRDDQPSRIPVTEAQRVPEPDDLTRIVGIGPKYAARLNDAGVMTFAQLAALTPADLQAIFASTGRVPNVSDWPAQAARLMES